MRQEGVASYPLSYLVLGPPLAPAAALDKKTEPLCSAAIETGFNPTAVGLSMIPSSVYGNVEYTQVLTKSTHLS